MRTQFVKVFFLALALMSGVVLAACSNTIRGAGRDVSNTLEATEDAVEEVVVE